MLGRLEGDFITNTMNKLTPPIPNPTVVANAHARRLIKAANDLAQVISESYADQPERPTRTARNSAGVVTTSLATPAVPKTAIQTLLGTHNQSVLDQIEAIFNAIPAPAATPVTSAPAAA